MRPSRTERIAGTVLAVFLGIVAMIALSHCAACENEQQFCLWSKR